MYFDYACNKNRGCCQVDWGQLVQKFQFREKRGKYFSQCQVINNLKRKNTCNDWWDLPDVWTT
jgi:hypothetical protein